MNFRKSGSEGSYICYVGQLVFTVGYYDGKYCAVVHFPDYSMYTLYNGSVKQFAFDECERFNNSIGAYIKGVSL